MSPYDEFMAYASMRMQGMSDAEIAEHFGVGKKHVLQRMKLAAVHKTILNAHRKGDIDLDTVMAFTLSDSQKEQLAAFNELGDRCRVWNVRRHLTKDGETANGTLAQFVTLAAYKAAGGRVMTDLFGDESYLLDDDLLQRLADKKLASSGEKLRRKEGWDSVEVSVSRPDDFHQLHSIEPQLVDAPSELTDALSTAVETQQSMDEADEDWTEEREAQYAALEQTVDALEDKLSVYREYSDEDKARSQCFVFIGRDGKAEIHRGVVSQAKHRAAERADAQDGAEAETKAALPNTLVKDLGVHRQHVAKAALATNATLASDVLLFTLCDNVLSQPGYRQRAIDANFTRVMPDAEGIAETTAAAALEKARGALATEWLNADSAAERFAAFRQLKPKAKQALMAYSTAECLTVELAQGASDEISEAVLVDLAPDFASAWRPTADNYFRRLKRDALLVHGEAWFGSLWLAKHAAYKKKDLVAILDAFFKCDKTADMTPEQREIHAHWLPDGFVVTRESSSS